MGALVETVAGVAATAAFSALGTAIASWVSIGNRVTKLEAQQTADAQRLERIEANVSLLVTHLIERKR